MAKLTRQQQQIFAGQAPSDMIAAFGTTQTGKPVYSTDLSTLQTTNYQQGWQDAVIADKAPFLEEMNGVMYGTTYQLAYLMQQGIPEWDAGTTYYTNSRAMGSDGNIYTSLVDENTGNNPTTDDGTHWNIDSTDINDKITNCILEAPNGVAEWSGVTPTGSLTNNQGVVSGFSESNYLTINKIPETVNSFEMEFCITTGSTTSSDIDQCITGQPDNYTSPQFQISHETNKFEFLCGLSSSAWGQLIRATNTVNLNTTYWLRALWDGTTIYFYLKTSKEADWELQGTTQQSYVEWSEVMLLGIDNHVDSLNKPFLGSIDLSQSYIKINGEIFWQGNDLGFNQFRAKQGLKTLIPNGRNENGTLRNIENTLSQDLTYTFEDNATGSYWAAVGANAVGLRKTSWEYKNDENYIIGTLENVNLGQKAPFTMIGEMEVKNGNIVSFTPYNPVSLATKDEIDGMWVGSFYNVFTDVSFTSGQSMTYSLSDYLPKDGNIYEVIFSGKVTTGATAGDTGYMQLETSVFPQTTSFVACQTPTNRSMFVAGTTTAPVGADRNITISNASASDTATFQLRLSGYRKVR